MKETKLGDALGKMEDDGLGETEEEIEDNLEGCALVILLGLVDGNNMGDALCKLKDDVLV